MSTPSSSAILAQGQKRPPHTAGPTTPAATTSMAATPRSQPTPSTSHPMQMSSPNATRTGASPAAQRGGLAGKHLAGKTVAGQALGTATGSPAPGGLGTPTPQGAASVSSMQHTGSSLGLGGSGVFDSPLGLGVLDGTVGMGMGMSMGGLGATVMGKADDEEKRRRLEAILASVGGRPGRLSQEGLERLSRRHGMEVMWEEGMGEDKRTLSMAGSAIVVDVEFGTEQLPVVNRVALSFHGLNDSVTEHADAAAKILQEDLTPPSNLARLNATLDKFATNLDRLSRLDRLSVPGANCFEAISGVYTSLKRLYEHEKKAAEELLSAEENGHTPDYNAKVSSLVMCKRSGNPSMHTRRTVGLSLDYWKDSRLVKELDRDHDPTKDSDSNITMSIDHVDKQDRRLDKGTYSIVVECEHVPVGVFPTIRVTDQWISDRIEKPGEPNEVPLDPTNLGGAKEIEWLEPPAPLIPAVQTNPAGQANTNTGRPKSRFVAKFNPPIILPLQIASQVFGSLGINLEQEPINAGVLTALLLPGVNITVPSPNMPGQALVKRKIYTFPPSATDGLEKDSEVGLFISRNDAGIRLNQIPFVHPRQLITLFPVLRQYAYITRLLRNSFNGESANRHDSTGHSTSKKDSHVSRNEYEMELDAMLSDVPKPVSSKVDVSFAVFPQPPHFEVSVPYSKGVKRATFAVLPNAEVEVTQQDIVPVEDGAFAKKRHDLAQGLMVSEDIVVWAEWVKSHYLATD